MTINPPIGSLAPIGSVVAFAGNLQSLDGSGWLVCDGRQVTQAEYPLFVKAIGKLYGGDGVNNAQLPDMRGLFIRGVDGRSGKDPDVSLRTKASGSTNDGVGSTQSDGLANHQHKWDHFFHNFSKDGEDIACHQSESSPNLQKRTENATNTDGGFVDKKSSGSETRPKNIALFWIIKAG